MLLAVESRRAARTLSAEPLAFLRLLNRLWGAIKNFMASPKSHSFTRPRCRRSTYLLFIIYAHLSMPQPTYLHFFIHKVLQNSPPRHDRIKIFAQKSWFIRCARCCAFNFGKERVLFTGDYFQSSRCGWKWKYKYKIKWAGQKSSRGDNWREPTEVFACLIRAARREGRKQPLCG